MVPTSSWLHHVPSRLDVPPSRVRVHVLEDDGEASSPAAPTTKETKVEETKVEETRPKRGRPRKAPSEAPAAGEKPRKKRRPYKKRRPARRAKPLAQPARRFAVFEDGSVQVDLPELKGVMGGEDAAALVEFVSRLRGRKG